MAIVPEDALGLDEAAVALDNGWTLPARWYSDPQVAELEYQRIFATTGRCSAPRQGSHRQETTWSATPAGCPWW